ncbi:hypothetical protein O3M35_006737 [Rhynocoris fuscipes]|uniref:Uncharacterized protein n=1 Tax=Rhynocoris fuscipes TaxID=488301 RepID=A0AAW1DI97_9HEMI
MKATALLLIVALVSFSGISSVDSKCLPRGASCNRVSPILSRCCYPLQCSWNSATCKPPTYIVNG